MRSCEYPGGSWIFLQQLSLLVSALPSTFAMGVQSVLGAAVASAGEYLNAIYFNKIVKN